MGLRLGLGWVLRLGRSLSLRLSLRLTSRGLYLVVLNELMLLLRLLMHDIVLLLMLWLLRLLRLLRLLIMMLIMMELELLRLGLER